MINLLSSPAQGMPGAAGTLGNTETKNNIISITYNTQKRKYSQNKMFETKLNCFKQK